MLGSVVNEEGGTISGVRYGVLAVSGASVTNAGTISGAEIGVVIGRQASAGKAGELVNSGTIDGGVAIEVDRATATNSEIGRAACRERVCQYVELPEVAV